jgi:hypothetical protein
MLVLTPTYTGDVMRINEAAKRIIDEFNLNGKNPLIRVDPNGGDMGLCFALSVHSEYAYWAFFTVFGTRVYGSSGENFGVRGDFNEHRMNALCLLAAMTNADLDYFVG